MGKTIAKNNSLSAIDGTKELLEMFSRVALDPIKFKKNQPKSNSTF